MKGYCNSVHPRMAEHMAYAAQETRKIDMSVMDGQMSYLTTQLYSILTMLLKDDVLETHMSVQELNGFETWRLLWKENRPKHISTYRTELV